MSTLANGLTVINDPSRVSGYKTKGVIDALSGFLAQKKADEEARKAEQLKLVQDMGRFANTGYEYQGMMPDDMKRRTGLPAVEPGFEDTQLNARKQALIAAQEKIKANPNDVSAWAELETLMTNQQPSRERILGRIAETFPDEEQRTIYARKVGLEAGANQQLAAATQTKIATDRNASAERIAKDRAQLQAALARLSSSTRLAAADKSANARTYSADQAAASAKLRAEMGMWEPLVDEQGNITHFLNKRTRELEANPVPGLRKKDVSFSERKEGQDVDYMLDTLEELKVLAEDNPQATGPIQGRFWSIARNFADAPNDIESVHRMSREVLQKRLYALSGKAINEHELPRLESFLPKPSNPDGRFLEAVNAFERELMAAMGRFNPAIRSNAATTGRHNPADPTRPQAGGKKLTTEQAMEYLKKAGRDRAKAEELAKRDGYSF